MKTVQSTLSEHEIRIKALEDSDNLERIDKAIMQKDLTTISETVMEIKTDVKSLSDKRLNDHYIEPMANFNKLKWALYAVVATSLITMLISIITNAGK